MHVRNLKALALRDVQANGIESSLPAILKSLQSLQSSLLRLENRTISQATLTADYMEVLYDVERLEVGCDKEIKILRETDKGVPLAAYEYDFQSLSAFYGLVQRLRSYQNSPVCKWELAEDLIRAKTALWRMHEYIDDEQLKLTGEIKYEAILHRSRPRTRTFA